MPGIGTGHATLCAANPTSLGKRKGAELQKNLLSRIGGKGKTSGF